MKKIFLATFLLLSLTLVLKAQGWEVRLGQLTSAIKCSPGLYGLDGAQWAGRANLSLPADEVKYIIAGFTNPRQVLATGPRINGIGYMTLRADNDLIILKHGMDGVVCKKSKQAVTICKFSENNVTPGQALIATSNFTDYLKNIGF